ncbi:hypothetical protein EV2_027282 [Malus domestica]
MRYLPVEFMTLTAVDDEFSRAMLSKQPGKGLRQSVPDWRFDFRFRLTALFFFVLQVWARTKTRTWRKHDMRYSCFRP